MKYTNFSNDPLFNPFLESRAQTLIIEEDEEAKENDQSPKQSIKNNEQVK